jgi:glutathione-regulated potassium-efflux system protein KefB
MNCGLVIFNDTPAVGRVVVSCHIAARWRCVHQRRDRGFQDRLVQIDRGYVRMTGSTLLQVAVFLAASAIAAPLARWLRIGSIIGYLGAGVLIGPYGLGFVYTVYQVDSILHFAEFGVVLLLFLIGLELRPARLWAMRRSIFGAGGAQLIVSAAAIGAACWAIGYNMAAATVLGFSLALSSTAFALQSMEERKELNHRHGRLGFSILLLQDIAAIPLVAIVPLLAVSAAADHASTLFAIAKAIVIIVLVIALGRWVLGSIYRLVAKSGMREAMTASALLTVVGIALLMQSVGLSAALGAFIAGALLADSEYRHQIEADTAPFEGLLLGLFFTAIGMTLNLRLLGEELPLLLALAASLLAIKAIILYAIGRWLGLSSLGSRRLALFLAQGGEFAFVVLALAAGAQVVDRGTAEVAAVVVTLSMMATPLLLILDETLRRKPAPAAMAFDTLPATKQHVVIAGFGRVGQVVARILRAKRIPFTALDISPSQVQLLRRFGAEAYFGDATRLDILQAAKTAEATAFVLAIDNVEDSVKVAGLMRQYFPHVPVYARARNRQHVYRLMDMGVTELRRETFLASVELTRDLLSGLKLSDAEIARVVDTFVAYDRKRLYDDYEIASDSDKLMARARDSAKELEALLAADEAEAAEAAERTATKVRT